MIASRFERYVNEGLGLTGFVLLDHQIAFTLRRDIWATPLMAAQEFSWRDVQTYVESLPRVKLYEVELAGGELVPVAARSADRLAERITWVTGLVVEGLHPFNPVVRQPAPTSAAVADEPGPPAHQCAARAEWFQSRGLEDPNLPKKQPQARIYG